MTGRVQRHNKILFSPIVQALGPARTAALPGFHTWSGADITGSFACKGKLGYWKAFLEADEDSVTALANLGTTVQPTSSTIAAPAKDAHFQGERYEMVPVPGEASPIGKTTSNASCIIASTLPDNGMEQ